MRTRIGTRKTLVCLALVLGTATLSGPAYAQAGSNHGTPDIDVAITYQALRSDHASGGSSFFLQGGAAEVHARLLGGLGVVASLTGEQAGSSATGAAPINFVSTVFGPRYTFARRKRASLFLEGLAGEINAFHSSFPLETGSLIPQTDANSIAVLAGGGIDLNLRPHIAIRVAQLDWLHTQLPNGAGNTQNNLRLGAGLVMRFGK